MNNNWTPKQRQFIADNWKTMTDQKIARALGLRDTQVKAQRVAMGLMKNYTQEPKAPPPDTSRFFDPHALECWITGSMR